VFIVARYDQKKVYQKHLMDTLNRSVLPEVLALSEFDHKTIDRASPLTSILIDHVIDQFYLQLHEWRDYLKTEGSKNRLLDAFCYFHDYQCSPKRDDWITPLYDLFISLYFTHQSQQPVFSPSYLKDKTCVFLGVSHRSPREETLMKRCMDLSLSSSVHYETTPRSSQWITSWEEDMDALVRFPELETPSETSITLAQSETEDDEVLAWVQRIKTFTTPITFLCPNVSYIEKLERTCRRHNISINSASQKPALSQSVFQFMDYICDCLLHPRSIQPFKSLFSHPFSHTIIMNSTPENLRSDIMFHLIFHLQTKGEDWEAALTHMSADLLHYLEHTYVEEKSTFKHNMPAVLQSIKQLQYLLDLFKESSQQQSKDQLQDMLVTIMSHFVESQHTTSESYQLLEDWLKMKHLISEHNDYFFTITLDENISLTTYLITLKRTLAKQHYPQQNSNASVSVQLWSSFPVIYQQTLIILGFTNTNWTPPLPDNDMIPDTMQAKYKFDLTLTDDDIRYHLHRYCSSTSTILSIPSRTSQGHALPHRLLGKIETQFDLKKVTLKPTTGSINTSQHSQFKPHINFSSPEVKHHLKNTLSHHTFSSSQLETYQNCPYAYFLSSLMNFSALNEHRDDISGAEWGSLLHDMLYQSFNALENNAITSAQDPRFERVFIESCKNCFDSYRQDTLYWDVKELLCFGTETEQGLLQTFIDHEKAHPLPLKPRHLELSLTQTVSLSSSAAITIKGIIDCVLSDSKKVAVLDYKSGKTLPTYKDIETLSSLQLSIYLLLLKHTYPDLELSGGLYYKVHSKAVEKKVMLTTEDDKKNVYQLKRQRPFLFNHHHWENLLNRLQEIRSHMLEGLFSPDLLPAFEATNKKRSQTCSYCDYKHYCRYHKRFSSWR